MENLNTVAELKSFCRKNNISFSITDRKNDLLDKIEAWEDKQRAIVEKKEKIYTARQFGQLRKIGPVMIQYLEKQFSKTETHSYEEWVKICIDKKVID